MTRSILQEIAGGDPGAVRKCIDQYGALVWGLARRLSTTPSDAEDATQEIFLQIWRHAARFDGTRGSEKTFIAMIARRRLIDRLRKNIAEPLVDCSAEMLESVPCSRADPSSVTETGLEVERAMRALAELRSEQRQVLELGFLRGMAHAEIAKHLNMPLGTVKSNLRRGLVRLRKCMEGATRQGIRTPTAARIRTVKKPYAVPSKIPDYAVVSGA